MKNIATPSSIRPAFPGCITSAAFLEACEDNEGDGLTFRIYPSAEPSAPDVLRWDVWLASEHEDTYRMFSVSFFREPSHAEALILGLTNPATLPLLYVILGERTAISLLNRHHNPGQY